MDLSTEARRLAAEALSDIRRADIGAEATPEQKLAIAHVYATLAVAENLAALRDTDLDPGLLPTLG